MASVKTGVVKVRKSEDRGRADFGWLDSRHTFSFGEYHDPDHMGFRSLRVINQDRVAPGRGFPTHPHRDMEIFSYVLAGELEHKDSLGNGRRLAPGQIQLMSAGTGVTHSEYNPSTTEGLHFLQIWLQPSEHGRKPGYTEWHPNPGQENAPKVLVISTDGREGSAIIHQDADIYRVRLAAGASIAHDLGKGRGVWLQLIAGRVTINGHELKAGDGASVEQAASVQITSVEAAEALLFDLR